MIIKTDDKVYKNNVRRNVILFSLLLLASLFVSIISFIILYDTLILVFIALFMIISIFDTLMAYIMFKLPRIEKDLEITIEENKIILKNKNVTLNETIFYKDIDSYKEYRYKNKLYKVRIYYKNENYKFISFKEDDLVSLIESIRNGDSNA